MQVLNAEQISQMPIHQPAIGVWSPTTIGPGIAEQNVRSGPLRFPPKLVHPSATKQPNDAKVNPWNSIASTMDPGVGMHVPLLPIEEAGPVEERSNHQVQALFELQEKSKSELRDQLMSNHNEKSTAIANSLAKKLVTSKHQK